MIIDSTIHSKPQDILKRLLRGESTEIIKTIRTRKMLNKLQEKRL